MRCHGNGILLAQLQQDAPCEHGGDAKLEMLQRRPFERSRSPPPPGA